MVYKSHPMFSLIVPIYNKQRYLRESLLSLQNQTYCDFEVICVDDASTDDSIRIVKEFADNDPRFVLVLNKKNQGVSKSRNQGIECAKGKWLLFIDADDRIEATTLELLEKQISQNINIDLILFNGSFVTMQGEVVADFYSNQIIPNIPEYKTFKVDDYPLILHYVNAALVCVRSAFVAQNWVYFSPDMRHEDWDFMWKLFSFDPVIFYMPDHLYSYVIAPDGYTVSQGTTFQSLDLFKAYSNGKSYLKRLNTDNHLNIYMCLVALRHFWDFLLIKILRTDNYDLQKEYMRCFHRFLVEINKEQFNKICGSHQLLANAKALIKIRKHSSDFFLLLVLYSLRPDIVECKKEIRERLRFMLYPLRWFFQPFKILQLVFRYLIRQYQQLYRAFFS